MVSSGSHTSTARLPRWVVFADILAAAFFLVGAIALVTDGLVVTIGDMQLSARGATRPFAWFIGIVVIRYSFVRQPLPIVARVLRREPPLFFEEHQLFAPWPRSLGRRVTELALITLSFSALVAVASWPMVAQPYAVSDMGDPLFSIWRLMWVQHEFWRNPLNLFNANQMYPAPRTLTFSDPVLASALLFAPLQALGLHRIVAYNVVFLSGWVFSGVTMFLLVRALTGRADAGWIAGAIFAIYPYRTEHLAHLELQMTIWIPIVLWFLHRTIVSGRLRDGLATGAALAAQFYSALYYGAFAMTYTFVVGMVLWLARGRPWKPVRALSVGGVLAGLLLVPLAIPYLKTRSELGNRKPTEVAFYSADGADYLKAHDRSLIYRSLSEGGAPERSLFPRIVPVLLALIALWPPLSVTRAGYALALGFSVEVSLGTNGSIFPWLYAYVPPYAGIRVPARYSIFVGMTLAILSGYGAARCFRRWPAGRAVLFAAMVGAIIFEGLPRIELEHPWREPPAIYEPLIGAPTAVLAEFPTPADDVYSAAEFVYLYFSTFHWHKLVNGQSGWLPPSYIEFVVNARSFPSDESVNYLRHRGVQYISIHGTFYPPDKLRRVLTGVEARTDMELLAEAEWEGSPSRLYRLR